MSEADDADLMASYARGSAEAFDTLYARYRPRAWGYFLRRTRSEPEAAELYQELFLRLHRFRDRYDPSLPFAPWFFRIADHVWIDALRRRRVRPQLEDPVSDEIASDDDAERAAVARQEVASLLAELTPEQRRVVLATQLEGRSYESVAAEIGKTPGALRQLGARALRKLRRSRESG